MKKRLDLIERHLQTSGGRFLDCGCGSGGYVLSLMERFQLDAHGIELDEDKVKRARGNTLLQERVERGDLQAINFPANTWDYAMLNEVLEHVPDDRRALKEVYRILKPSGLLFIFSPNRWFPFETHGVRLKRSVRLVPHWIPFIPYIPLRFGSLFFDYWARNYWQKELADMARASGFSIVERSFIWLTFEGISGYQPRFIRAGKPLLRFISDKLERLPIVKKFGLSQVLVCRK
ncbi:MAG: class I SAM-dependent methyltransferase [Verrucomicrobiota bacterium]|jgi:ubiquinone/menaquinone biosynthesis C-methylase UbiE